MANTYKTITSPSTSEFKDRGSRFIGLAIPVQTVDEVKAFVKSLKTEHPKAVHFCFAYRIGYDKTNFRANDDGEPSGSAGKPILGQIDSFNLTNVLIVVIRYFGGVLLGVPGLINAYKTTAQLSLTQSTIVEKDIEKTIYLEFDYTMMNEIMKVIKHFSCRIIQQDLGLFCKMTLSVSLQHAQTVKEKLQDQVTQFSEA